MQVKGFEARALGSRDPGLYALGFRGECFGGDVLAFAQSVLATRQPKCRINPKP